ncbi:glycerate kinase [Bifidobacterium adolescentis]|uniref:glycerate kinase family protein n=1 Tax=Bifidobacterium adolescentis TaxID=1680 RepID=UPI00165D5624|nr:glycerate kinase [Bifidobacterium adolescentis]MBC9858402.1 glycerate kinase [Bifidobacterium adolescentis]
MRILLAPDSFKEAASAEAIAQAMARGIKRGDPQAECRLLPLSDGGEGLTHALVHATGGTLHDVETVDAVGRPIIAQFGFLGNNHASCILRTAVVELASASGLEQVSPADRNALSASTFGTGLLIRAAIDAGANRIVLGLGGSATTDGGTGLARALGFRFLDTAGHDIPLGGGSLVDLERIDDSEVPDFVKNVPIVLACDVTNPLTGPEGAAHVFAPQKGANTAQIELLDQGLANLAHAIMQYNGRDIERIPGTGAAGGTGGGMLGLFNTTVRPGIELVLDLTHGREACAWADVIITGEGSIDSQTPYGKVPSGIAKLAQSQGKPTIAIGGTVTRDPHTIEALNETGIVATFGIAPGPADLATLIANTERNVEITCAAIAGTLRVASATAVTAATSPCESA